MTDLPPLPPAPAAIETIVGTVVEPVANVVNEVAQILPLPGPVQATVKSNFSKYLGLALLLAATIYLIRRKGKTKNVKPEPVTVPAPPVKPLNSRLVGITAEPLKRQPPKNLFFGGDSRANSRRASKAH